MCLNLLLSNTWTECCCMYWWRNLILAVGNNVMMDERLDFSSQCHQRCSSFLYFYWVMEFMICIILTNHLRLLPWGVKPLGTPEPPLSFLLCPSGLQICLAGRRHRSAPVVSANNDKDVMVFRDIWEISGRGCLTSLSLYLYTHIHINTDTDFTVSKSEWNINIIQRVSDPACALWLFSTICQRNARPTMSWRSEYTQIRRVHVSFRVVKVICLHIKDTHIEKKIFNTEKKTTPKLTI